MSNTSRVVSPFSCGCTLRPVPTCCYYKPDVVDVPVSWPTGRTASSQLPDRDLLGQRPCVSLALPVSVSLLSKVAVTVAIPASCEQALQVLHILLNTWARQTLNFCWTDGCERASRWFSFALADEVQLPFFPPKGRCALPTDQYSKLKIEDILILGCTKTLSSQPYC